MPYHRAGLTSSCLVLAALAAAVPAQGAAQAARRPAAARAPDSAAVAVERSIWEHAVAGRWDRVNAILEGALTVDDSGISPWTAARTEALRTMGCTITGYAMRDVATRTLSGDAVVVAYRAELPMRCAAESPTWQFRYMSTFRRRGAGWQLVATSITPVAPPKQESR
jgi:hypothetical protein